MNFELYDESQTMQIAKLNAKTRKLLRNPRRFFVDFLINRGLLKPKITSDQFYIDNYETIPVDDKLLSDGPVEPSEALHTQKKKILLYAGGMITNGVTTSVINLLDSIDYNLFEVFVICDAVLIDKVEERQVNFSRLNKNCQFIPRAYKAGVKSDLRALYEKFMKTSDALTSDEMASMVAIMKREVRRCLGEAQFDYAIEFSGYSPFWGLFMACIDTGEKIIFQHSDMLAEAENTNRKNNLHRVFEIYDRFDRIISVTQELFSVNRDKLSKYYSDTSIVTYCRNGLGAAIIRERALQPLEIKFPQLALISQDERIFSFISVGRLSAEKNQARLLHAFAQVTSAGINSVLIVVGAGPEKKNLTKLARRLGIHERVIFCGLVENPYPLIQRAGCLVLSSDYEGQGLVLLEALALDVPCVAVNCPPVAAFLKVDFGRLCDPTPESMAGAMIDVARSRMRPIGFSAEEYDSQCRQEFLENVLGLSSQSARISACTETVFT